MKSKNKRVKIIKCIFLLILPVFFMFLFITRLITPTEIDDVSPGIPCPEIQRYNPDVLYVIPNYNNNSISENKIWCDYILSLNKEIGIHGITHQYQEFIRQNITQEDLEYGISEFEECFGFKPEKFKSPQLKTSSQNKELIEQNNLEFRTFFNQLTHKVYHCDDSDIIKNKAIYIF